MAEHTIIENIEYLTQIHTAWDGTEQRFCLREKPRRSISYRYSGLKNWHSTWMRAFTYCKQGMRVDFPFWNGAIELPTDVTHDENKITIPTEDVWSYRDCHATMFWEDDDIGGLNFDIKEITATGLIRYNRTLTRDFRKNLSIMVPIFSGYVLQVSDYTNEHSELADMVINVEIVPIQKTIAFPYALNEFNYPKLTFDTSTNAREKYNGLELFMYPPQWAQGDSVSYDINGERLDNNTGTFRYDFRSLSQKASRTTDYVAKNKADLHYLERFFYRCRGRWISFYTPTWTNDFQMVEDAIEGSMEVYVKLNLYYKYYAKDPRRRTICVFFIDGTIEILQVAGFSYDLGGTKGRVYLAKGLPKDFRTAEITMISFLVCARHNSDVMTINHETTGAAIVSFEMVEVNE